MSTIISLKVAQGPRLHVRQEKFSKQIRLHGFFSKKNFEKTLFLTVFHIRSPISQNRDRIQSPWFRKLNNHFTATF